MQTTPHPARTSAPTQFSATFEKQGSGTIYNSKYMLDIGKKLRMWNCFTMENPLRTKSHFSHTVSIKHNVLKCSFLTIPHKIMNLLILWNADNTSSSDNITPMRFSATFENQGSGTIYNTKYMFAIGKKLRMWHCFTMENPLERNPTFLTQCL